MCFNYRIKVFGHTLEELSRKGFMVNNSECTTGELWVIGASRVGLERACLRYDLKTISKMEVLDG